MPSFGLIQSATAVAFIFACAFIDVGGNNLDKMKHTKYCCANIHTKKLPVQWLPACSLCERDFLLHPPA